MAHEYVLGIDLGTYNSAAMVMTPDGDLVPISASPERRFWRKTGERIKPFPSVVVFHSDGSVRAVGYDAKEIAISEPHLAAWGVKRLLGKSYKEAKEHGELDRLLLSVEPDDENGRTIFEFKDRDIRPEQVCAELLKHMKEAAESQIGTKLPNVTLSVPAYFDGIHVPAIVEAATLAGFDRVDTVPEPVAAALAYDIHITPRTVYVGVIDIGAGTLDCTTTEIWRTTPGPEGIRCETKKNTGHTHLGGLDMDDRIVELLRKRLKLEYLSDQDRLKLRRAAEAAKIALSDTEVFTIEININQEKKAYTLHRDELEKALRADESLKLEGVLDFSARDLLYECEQQVRLALQGAGWTPEDLDILLLVGGPTAMPCVRNMLKGVFRANPRILAQINEVEERNGDETGFDPMLAVAMGAAIYKGSREHVKKIHPYGYGFIEVRAEPLEDMSTYKIVREQRILVDPDTEFPSDASFFVTDDLFYRGDKIFSLEVIQQVPDSEKKLPGMPEQPYRFLGEFQLAYTRIPFRMQVSMRLNENGELETTIKNLLGFEKAKYIGIAACQRHGIELPTAKLHTNLGTGRWRFFGDETESVRQWAEGFSRFMHSKVGNPRPLEAHMQDRLAELDLVLSSWGDFLEGQVNKVYTLAMMLLQRGHELKIISESERYQWEQELVARRGRCYRYEEG
jgi:molecular chaperone DnaK (HSP70)